MGHAASTYEKELGAAWDQRPCEFFGADDKPDVPASFGRVRKKYERKRRENKLGTEAMEAFGDDLLGEECLEVEFADAGTWTRVTVRDTSDHAAPEPSEDPTFMYHAQDPGAFLLTRTSSRSSLRLAPAAPAERKSHHVRTIEDLVRKKHEGGSRPRQCVVAFVDGSEAAHVAYVAAKSLVKGSDTLSVITVESSKAHTSPNFKPTVIRDRYETDLTAYLPSARWRFITIPKSKVPTKDVVRTFVNDRAQMPCAVRTHPDPTVVCVGFSGRKSRESRDPTVVGQVADLSLRTMFCPTVVCKVVPRSSKRHFVVLVEPSERSVRAVSVLDAFLAADDALTFLHVTDPRSAATAPEDVMARLGHWKKRADFEFVENANGRGDAIVDVLQHDARPCFSEVDFVVVATRPKSEPGSVSDHLVRHYHGNILIIKTVVDSPNRRSSAASRPGMVPVGSPDGRRPSAPKVEAPPITVKAP